jgi:hypothetical protein
MIPVRCHASVSPPFTQLGDRVLAVVNKLWRELIVQVIILFHVQSESYLMFGVQIEEDIF